MKITSDMRTVVRTKLLDEIVGDLREALSWDGNCDHSVGICYCEQRLRVIELEKTIRGGRNLVILTHVGLQQTAVHLVVHHQPDGAPFVNVRRKRYPVAIDQQGRYVTLTPVPSK